VVGGVKSFTQVLQVLGRQPRNNQLIATMTIDPAPGKPGSRPAVTRKVRTATQIVTGRRSIPVNVTRQSAPNGGEARSRATCVFPAQRSAWWRLDNCYRDQAVTNARQLADMLTSADAAVVSPSD
jgi:hypothetical protein